MNEHGRRSAGLVLALASLLAGFATLCAAGTPASTANREAPCRFFYFKEPIDLELDTRRVAVRYRRQLAAAAGKRLSAEAGVRLSRRLPTGAAHWHIATLETPGAGAADIHRRLQALAHSPEIEFASPVFHRADESWMIVTSGILLRFVADAADRGDALLAELAPELEVVAADFGGMPGAYHLRSPAGNGFAVLATANRLARDPRVAWAEPDIQCQAFLALIPNDPNFNLLWGIRNTGQSGGTPDMDMDGDLAWDINIGSADIQVLILDSGVQQNHPDINQNPGADFTGQGGGGGPVTTYDNHGTAVAGCASAIINNGIGVVGIAPGCKVLSAKIFVQTGPNPSDLTFQSSWLVNALNWGQSQGARCSSSSFTVGSTSSITDAYQSARNGGMVHFAATGNAGVSSISYPASLPTINAIGGINRNGTRYGNYGTGLAFTAPAVEIYTTDRTGSAGYAGGNYTWMDGTSFASPYAAGVGALILSQDPSLTPNEVESKMESTAKDLGATGYDTQFGWGLVNANNFDCNNNGIADNVDIASGSSDDCQPDGVPDECQLSGNDCNGNLIPDDCEEADLITGHPLDAVPCPGATATFTVTAVGSPGYQWYKDDLPLSDGGDVSGATTDTLVISNVDGADEGVYKCKVTSGCLEPFTNPATLTLGVAPAQSGTLGDLDKCEGDPATFIASFTGTPPPIYQWSYQWEKDGVPIPGETTDTLTLDPVTPADAGGYRCQATNDCGSAYTNTATLTVDPAPTITDQPDDACAEVSETAVFTVAATGQGSLWYQWLKDGFDLSGEGGWDYTTLTLTNVQPGDAGQYSAYVLSSLSPGCLVYSDEATLQVGGCPACLYATPGDMDDDTDVDLYDFALFQACFGPGMGLVAGCECANMDDSNYDVDLSDYSLWYAGFSGPS